MTNPFGVRPPTLDLVAIAVHNGGVARATADYRRGYVIDKSCDTCTDFATCGRCRYEARQLLKVATSQDECASLLEIADRPSPFAAKCGTIAGHYAHRHRNEKPCVACLDAHNTAQRRRYHARKEAAK